MDSPKTRRRRGNPRIAELGRATRFHPGQSGNPGGRPSRTPYADAHREVAELQVSELRILPNESVAIAIAKSVAKRALDGNISAAAEAANRAEGTPRQRPEPAANNPLDVTIRFVGPGEVELSPELQSLADSTSEPKRPMPGNRRMIRAS
jgi:hypothetical protein